DRVVEELLDRAVEQGFVNMSDLRDAIARNRLKLPDLRIPGELIVGDPLLKANRRLAEAADGVYRGGEIYRRIMQRLRARFFGTRLGRFLTLYLILPFGGAYMLLAGIQHTVIDLFYHVFDPQHSSDDVHLLNYWSLSLLGFFLLGIIYWPWFRQRVVS